MVYQTPPRPPPPPRPPSPPPAPRRPRAAGGVAPAPAGRGRVLMPPLIFGNGSPPGGGPARSRKQRKQRKQTRKQKQRKN